MYKSEYFYREPGRHPQLKGHVWIGFGRDSQCDVFAPIKRDTGIRYVRLTKDGKVPETYEE